MLLRRAKGLRRSDGRALPESHSNADAVTLVRIGVAVFALGLVAIVGAIVPLFFGVHDLPTWLNVAAGVLAPLGLGLALIGLLRAMRRPGP